MPSYDIGDRITLTASFTNDGVAVAPTTVTCTVLDPAGTSSNAPTSSPSTGTYTASYEPTQQGRHYYRFEGTGAYVAAEEGHFDVRRQRVA